MKAWKKRIASITLAMVWVLSFAGCGNAVPAMNEKNSEMIPEKVTEMAEDSTSPDEIIADAGEPDEQREKADKTAEQAAEPVETIASVETEKPAQTAEPAATEEPAELEKPVATEEPAEPEKPVATEKPAATEKPVATPKPAATEKPVETKKPVEATKPADNQVADASGMFVCDYCGYKTSDFMECLVHVLGHEQVTPSEPTESESEESTPAESESTGSEQPHEHNWIAHTDQRWVSQIVTVVDEPERYEKYDTYLIYWYNTNTWEETRNPDRFVAWWHDMEGGPMSESASFKNYEDNPLFLGYDENGHPSFIGNHTIRSNHDYVPAVTHEEDQGYYETYVDYYYCDCGATK